MKRAHGLMVLAALSLAISACGGAADDKSELDRIDSKLGGKGDADPALADQILVDPELAAQSNGSASRAGGQTLGTLAAKQAQVAKDKFNGCSLDVAYSLQWANRLPQDLPLYPGARVSEAAGSDYEGCRLRVASFTAPAPPKTVAGYYLELAKRSGFRESTTKDGQGLMVSGWRPGDGAAFYALLNASGTGTSVDLVSNRGR